MPDSSAAALPRSAEQEVLDALAGQARRVPGPVVLTSLVIASVLAPVLPVALVALWVVAVVGMQAVRWVEVPRLAADHARPERDRLAAATRLSLLNGAVHASCVFSFPWLELGGRSVITMILVGLCSGTVVSSAGWRPLFRAFAAPILGTLALYWALFSADGLGSASRVGVAVLIVFLYLLLQTLADRTSVAMTETFAIRSREVSMRSDLVDLNARLTAALDQAQAADRAKTRFLAAASHDLRQPLHALLLFSAALSMRKLDAKSQEIAARIDDATQALAYELDTLLDVSKLDAGLVRVNPERLDVGTIAARLVQTMTPIAHGKKLEIRCVATPGLYLDTDRALLERVLRNLLDNAIKYTDAGSIEMRVAADGPDVTIAVLDTGQGIAPAELERIFEEFYQIGNPERDRQRGLGLGLAIVRRLVLLLGGRLTVESQPGRGSTFTLRMPHARGAGSPVEPVLAAASTPPLAGLNVLVIDDEANVRLGTQLLLEGLGCTVSLVRDTDEACEVAVVDRPDIVLADMRLAGDDSGLRAVARLRALQPGLPALLISGDTAPDRLREARQAGLPLLHKPVSAELLARSITEAIRGTPGERAV
jgi:two-component system, sensor histidine kinase